MRHQYDFYVAPHRIIASRPDEPYKMTTMFESEDRHYHNYRRVKAMQQRQWNKEHMQYTTYPYAQREERDIYK
jgi:predicted metal-dependent HD superfamily phosphohydrolase